MPRNSSGVYSLPESSFTPNTVISSAAVNDDFDDIATALTGSVASNGVTPITAPLKNPAGSAGVPGVSHTSDASSGIYNPTVGKEGLVSGGVGILVNSLAFYCSAYAISTGGTGYVVGDRVTLTGGTYIIPVTLTVATLTGSAIATVTITTPGRYTTTPSNSVSQGSTSGSGSGATFNLTFASAMLITDITGANLALSLGVSPYAATSLLQLASSSDLVTALGIVTVPYGGLGTTTLVPYAPIVGGTISTSTAQTVASVGNSGDIFISNGAAIPAYAGTWVQTTPTPAPQTGSFGGATAFVRTKKVGTIVWYTVVVSVATIGSAAGDYIRVPLPYTTVGLAGFLGGRNTTSGVGVAGLANVGTAYVDLSTYTGAGLPVTTGQLIYVSGFCEVDA